MNGYRLDLVVKFLEVNISEKFWPVNLSHTRPLIMGEYVIIEGVK